MIDEIWMTRPQRRGFIWGTRARVSAMHEERFSSRIVSQSSSRISSMAPSLLLPALLIRMSTRPISASTASANRADSARSDRSASNQATLAPVPSPISRAAALQLVAVPGRNGDLGSGLRQPTRHGFAESAAAAGHQCDAAREVEQFVEHERKKPNQEWGRTIDNLLAAHRANRCLNCRNRSARAPFAELCCQKAIKLSPAKIVARRGRCKLTGAGQPAGSLRRPGRRWAHGIESVSGGCEFAALLAVGFFSSCGGRLPNSPSNWSRNSAWLPYSHPKVGKHDDSG